MVSNATPASGLRAEHLSYRTPDGKRIVDDVSFKLGRGNIMAIVGPNGAGKTTLIRMIAGLAVPETGNVFIGEDRLRSMRIDERARRIAYVGQSEEPDNRLTVLQYVSLGLLPHSGYRTDDEAISKVEQALKLVGLSHLSARKLANLSGGEKQKSKIARAICQTPSILVLDEPTNHLDPQARGELLSIVANTGTTVVAALHDLPVIDSFADTVAIIAGGRLTAFGPPIDILSNEQVRRVFNVELHRFTHPHEARIIPALDIPIHHSADRPEPN